MPDPKKTLITNLKPNEYIGLPIDGTPTSLGVITKVSEPRKAGKHGSAKVFYNYTVLKTNSKVQAVGKSRDEVTTFSFLKKLGQKIFEENEEVGFLTPEGEYVSRPKKDFIDLVTCTNEEEIPSFFHYFIFEDTVYYNKR